jgi:hypothetical protein
MPKRIEAAAPPLRVPARKGTTPPPAGRTYCPECASDITGVYDPPKQAGEFAICPKCAAIAVLTPEGHLRPCWTEEWWELMVSPKYHDLMSARIATLDRLTAPARR